MTAAKNHQPEPKLSALPKREPVRAGSKPRPDATSFAETRSNPRRGGKGNQLEPTSHPLPMSDAPLAGDNTQRKARRVSPPTAGAPSVEVNPDETRVRAAPISPASRRLTVVPQPAAHFRRDDQTYVGPVLWDGTLDTLASGLTDLETVRIAQANRLRILTRTEQDSDGEERGFGLDQDHPAVAALHYQLDALRDIEHRMELALRKQLRTHPLHPWIKAQVGLGDKQVARLLGVLGDPYWNTLHDRPRLVSELWAYCGLHVLPIGQIRSDTQIAGADGHSSSAGHLAPEPQSGDAGGSPLPIGQRSGATHPALADGHQTPASHSRSDAHPPTAGGTVRGGGDTSHRPLDVQSFHAGVAPARRRGQQCNWNQEARTRIYVIAESCMKNRHSPYRAVYDEGRDKYAAAVHAAPCAQCGPKGKPAPEGSDLRDGHKHARAMRLVMKAVLKDLWREAKRIHEETA